MAELVGLVSAIAALVSTGYRIAKTISDCVDDLGTAADQIMLVATDTKLMIRIFQELKIRLKNCRRVTEQVLSLAREMVGLGIKALEDIDACLLPLIPQIGKSFDPLRKAKWLFAKSKITSRRVSLDSLKLSMTIFLHTIDIDWGDADEYVASMLRLERIELTPSRDETKEEIEQLLVSTKETKMNFIKAEIFDQAVEHQYEPDEKAMELIGTPNDDDSDNEHALSEPEASGPGLETGDSYEIILTQRPATEGNSSDYTKVVLYEWALKHQADTKGPLGVMPVPSDDQFMEIADHLKLQMAVTKYARVTLSDSSPRSHTRPVPTWSHNKERDEASLKGMPNNQWSYQSDDSTSRSGMESMADASEPMEDRPGSDWRYTLPNRQYVSSPRQRANPSEASHRELPPSTAQYGHEQYPYNNLQADPDLQDYLRNYPQQNRPFPYYDKNWNQNDLAASMPTRQRFQKPRYEDPEKEDMKKQLELIKAAEAARADEEKQREFEARIKEEAEREFKLKMEERDRHDQLMAKERAEAMKRAKKEIDEAKQEAERTTRELMEKERIAAEERKVETEATIRRAQLAARDQLEAERQRAETLKRLDAEAVARVEQAAKRDTKGGLLSFWKRLDR